MLKIIRCPNPQSKREVFAQFNPKVGTWVVSDLQSKWQLQTQLLKQHHVLEGSAVLRATELWRNFSLQVLPKVHILSPELAQTVFWEWVKPMQVPWARSPQAIPVVIRQMQMWMSIFADPNFAEMMGEWFRSNQESYVRWGHWFELCAELWRRCEKENLVMEAWLPALLLNQDLEAVEWKKPLTFDLSVQISQVEAALFRALSRQQEIQVLVPDAPWSNLMPGVLAPYADLLGETFSGDELWQPDLQQNFNFGRFSTQLAEVKDCVGTVRRWLDQGIQLEKIAVVAPDIEEYWPTLQLYFQQEGVPVQKPVTAHLGGFVEMAQWLATLRTHLGKVSSSDLEMHFFSKTETPRLAFDQFKILFSSVYDALDLQRARHLFEVGTRPDLQEKQGAPEFLAWALQFWPAQVEPVRLLTLLQIVGREVSPELRFRPSEWLGYIEGLLSRREVTLTPADAQGISCASVTSADWLQASHAVFLNLSESALHQSESSPMRASEGRQIFADTGYALGSSDHLELEFELLWFMNRQWCDLRLNFSETNFQGIVQTPSRFWMWAGFLNDQLKTRPQLPQSTRWDQIQILNPVELCHFRELGPEQSQGLQKGLQRDMSLAVSTWQPESELKISASALERYWNCPFIFAAEKLLKLKDDPVLDLDMDRRTQGQLLHALVETLLQEPIAWDLSHVEMGNLVDQVRREKEILLGEERLWPAIKAQHIRLGQMFLKFEKDWRARFPNTRTVGRELEFKCYWDLIAAKPQREPTSIVMTGRLDRLDQDSQGRYAVLDYKASQGSSTNWASWLKNQQVQLALYSWMVELGLLEVPAGEVSAANYYVVKEADRRKGFYLKDSDAELYSTDETRRNWIDPSQKAELFLSLQKEIQVALLKMTAGEFLPIPKDKKVCPDCHWRTLCRAPHLN